MPGWEIELEVRCLRRPLHSGRGGGPVPDPIQVLCRLLARLPARRATVVRFDAPALIGSINQITDVTRARVRLAAPPGARGREVARGVARRLTVRPPHGASVHVRLARAGGGE